MRRPADNNETGVTQYQRLDLVGGGGLLGQNYDLIGDAQRFGILPVGRSVK